SSLRSPSHREPYGGDPPPPRWPDRISRHDYLLLVIESQDRRGRNPLWLNWRLTCLVVDAGCPLYPQKRTCSASASMSAKCQKRTYVPGELFLVVADTANLISDLRV